MPGNDTSHVWESPFQSSRALLVSLGKRHIILILCRAWSVFVPSRYTQADTLPGVGSLSAAAVAALFQDRIYKRLSRRKGDQGQPEYRVSPTLIFRSTLR